LFALHLIFGLYLTKFAKFPPPALPYLDLVRFCLK